MRFSDFQQTAEPCNDIGALVGADFYDSGDHGEVIVIHQAGIVYADNCYLLDDGDGHLRLQLIHDEWNTRDGFTREQLEAMLYAWWLSEYPDIVGMTGEQHAFICDLLDACDGYENFARALLANRDEPNGMICHFHDYCDANQCALDAAGVTDERYDATDDDGRTAMIDETSDLYDSCRIYLRG